MSQDADSALRQSRGRLMAPAIRQTSTAQLNLPSPVADVTTAKAIALSVMATVW